MYIHWKGDVRHFKEALHEQSIEKQNKHKKGKKIKCEITLF